MATFAVWLLILLPSGQTKLNASAKGDTTHQQASTAASIPIKEKPKQSEQNPAGAGDQQRGSARTPQPPRIPPRFVEHPWCRLMLLSDTDKIASALLIVTTLYLLATVGILLAMLKSNKHAESTYKQSKTDTETSLRLTREGQAATQQAVQIAANQLAAIINVARARLTISGITRLQPMLLRGQNSIGIEIVNRGHTPAIEVISFGRWVITSKDQLIDWDALPEFEQQVAHIPLIGAGLPAQATIELRALDAEEEGGLLSGDKELWIHGTLDYDDVFVVERESPERCFLQYTAVWNPVFGSWNVVGQADY